MAKMMNKKILMGALVLIGANTIYAQVGTLTRIIDGDTVKFRDITCRFSYIDTPESKVNNRLKKFLSDSCSGVTISTMLDAGKASSIKLEEYLKVGEQYKFNIKGEDKYKRKICEIYSKGEMVNLEMVKEGYALPFYRYLSNEVSRDFIKAYRNAKQKNKGLFKSHPKIMECLNNN